jgi:hypothetical protein
MLKNIINFFKRKNYPQQTNYNQYAHLYNATNSFTDEFYLNLIKTINWTEKIVDNINDKTQINYSTVLRSTNLNYEGKPFYNFDGTFFCFAATPEISFNYLTVLNEALLLRTDNTCITKNINQLGQILEFDIDLTTHDGAPCAASDGFVDESDIPPIDTWFYITEKQLYCWIPNMFIEKMQAAIDVEIFDSYRWIKDSNPSLQFRIVEKLELGQVSS